MENNKYLNNHDDCMNQALELAKRGRGLVSPNPLVGCIIVKNGILTMIMFSLTHLEAR